MRMPKHVTRFIIAIMVALGAAQLVAPHPTAGAIDLFQPCGTNCSSLSDNSLASGSGSKVKKLINLTLQILGGLAVIMVIVGAIRIAVSNGDANMVKAGRETIMYSVIGVVIALLAYAIVNFVVSFNW